MNWFKDHLDKVIAVLIIAAYLGWIARTHLSVEEELVGKDRIEAALRKLKRIDCWLRLRPSRRKCCWRPRMRC